MSETRWLTGPEQRAWRGYRRMRALLDLQITRDLIQDGLSDGDYDVLTGLSETPGQRLRLTELATLMHWSTSRLSHQVSRMQRRGLVDREEVAADGRGAEVVLTAAGLATIEAAAPAHVSSVREHFIDLLTAEQLKVLAELTETVVDHLSAAK
ncbi:MarR family transcriptional regulator [Fodinicola feengrottensis]|uniref:MarR family transcriptional regulator n=1 Tax=Fodinicola feengrottensis TaxID=435914 RepID=A0ABP4SPK6_9ACTN